RCRRAVRQGRNCRRNPAPPRRREPPARIDPANARRVRRFQWSARHSRELRSLMTPSNVYWGDWRHNSPPGGASNWRPLPTLWAQVHLAHRLQFADPLSTAAAARPNSVRARFALPASASRASEMSVGTVWLLGCLFLDALFGSGLVRRLWTTARTLGESRLDFLDRLGLGDPLNRRDLTRQPIERGFVQLPLRIGLLRLGLRPVKVTNHLGNGDDIAGIDLGFVFLGPARPHGALDARAALERLERALDQRPFGQLAHAHRNDLGSRDPQRHLVLDEIDDEQLQFCPRDFLLLDRNDLTHPVRGVDDKLVGLEALSLGSLFISGHSGHDSFTGPFAGTGRFGCGSPTANGAARGMGGPPRFGRLFRPPAHAGGTFL